MLIEIFFVFLLQYIKIFSQFAEFKNLKKEIKLFFLSITLFFLVLSKQYFWPPEFQIVC